MFCIVGSDILSLAEKWAPEDIGGLGNCFEYSGRFVYDELNELRKSEIELVIGNKRD